MPNYQYKVKDEIVDINFPMMYVGKEDTLPKELLEKISYLDDEGNSVLGTKMISQVSLAGFNSNGSSTNSTKSIRG